MTDSNSLILDSIFFSVPELKILQGAYLKVKPKSVTALFGRNGAGKSTLMKVASGQIKPDSGITIVDGERFYNRSVLQRFSHIGYLSQKTMLPDDTTVKWLIKSIPGSVQLKNDPFFKKLLKNRINTLSGGERRYLEISVLFSLNRKYLLLDEPFTGVEPRIIELILSKISREAKAGKGILLSDHIHRYIPFVAKEAYLMERKQCYKLRDDYMSELKEMGYLK